MVGVNLLVVGKPSLGKTTLVEYTVEQLRGSLRPLAGYFQEPRPALPERKPLDTQGLRGACWAAFGATLASKHMEGVRRG